MGIRNRVEFGDYQTPDSLAVAVCDTLRRLKVSARSVVEPTCGEGSFLRAAVAAFPEFQRLLGFEINPEYVQSAQAIREATVFCADFFEQDWCSTLADLPAPILVVGNPPWVTNSTIGAAGGSNLPSKSNFHHRRGIDALTGESNFDISEWMLIHLLESLSGREAALAMLCKTSVARKVLRAGRTTCRYPTPGCISSTPRNISELRLMPVCWSVFWPREPPPTNVRSIPA